MPLIKLEILPVLIIVYFLVEVMGRDAGHIALKCWNWSWSRRNLNSRRRYGI
jgi:hypothetical protein